MARQLSVAARERSTAEEVHRRYQLSMEDGTIDPEEDAWIEEAHDANIDACDRTEICLDLIYKAIETAAQGRRFKRAQAAFTLIRGGLGNGGL